MKVNSRTKRASWRVLMVTSGFACVCAAGCAVDTSSNEPSQQTSSAVKSVACTNAEAEDENTRDAFSASAAEAQRNGYARAGLEAATGCERLAAAKCRAQPKCVPGGSTGSTPSYTTNSAEEEAVDPTTGGPVTHHYSGPTLTTTAPSSWTPSSTTPGNTSRARPWKVNVTAKVKCGVACEPEPDADGGAEAGVHAEPVDAVDVIRKEMQ